MSSRPFIFRIALLCAALCLAPSLVSAQIPAFPGAQGFGAYATGGRGGDVYYVTNLNNNGAGSLRVGLDTAPAAGRTIVFAVSGYIPVVSDTNFNVPSKVTIAGQTAPGGGVGLRGGRMLISGNNVVMRHFRIRHGRNGTGGDCLNIASTAHTTMIDHVSMMFSTDENFSFFNSAINNFTMQYSSSSWGMERHNAGGLWDLQNGSCHHTLWAHHRTRNPKARPSLLEWINNVTFHWRNEGFIMGDSTTKDFDWRANVRGCYYISIDDADDGSTIDSTALSKARVGDDGLPNFSLYLDNTLFDNNDNGILDGANLGYGIVAGSEFQPGDPVGANRYYKSPTPFTGATGLAAVAIDDPLTGYKKVISSVGPLRLDASFAGPLRDELDALLIDTVVDQYSILLQKDGKVAGEDPNRPNNGEQLLADQYGITNNGFGTLTSAPAPLDSDRDGMPDSWETTLNGQHGMAYNPSAGDHNTVFTAGQLPSTFFPSGTSVGYTYLEEYLHFRAVPHAVVAKNVSGTSSSLTVDLRKYTDGFSNNPVFVISTVSGGAVAQFASNGTTPSSSGPIVRFTPTTGYHGRAGFQFQVTDSAGSTWTQQFAILVDKGETVQPPVRINVDFDKGSTYSGTAASTDAGTVWNTISAPAASSLTVANVLASNGSATPYDVTVTSSGATMSSWSEGALGNPNPAGLMADYFHGNTYTVTVSELPAGTYELFIYAHGDKVEQSSTVTIAAANGGGTATTGNSGTQYRNIQTAGAQGYSYLKFEPTVGSGGTLVFTAANYINGFQLVTKLTENYFVNMTTVAGTTGSTQTIASMAGWGYSAAAPVPGNTWTVFNEVDFNSSFPNPLNIGQTWTITSNVPLITADGLDKKARMTVVYHAVSDTLTDDRLRTIDGVGTIQAGGVMEKLMRNYWDRSGTGNFQRFTISNLRTNSQYLLYVYGASNGTAGTYRAGIDLDLNGTMDLSTVDGLSTDALFVSTGGGNYGLTAQGQVWNKGVATTDASGNLVFDSRLHLCGFQLIAYQAPQITTHPGSQTVNLGEQASFSVVAQGQPALSYQWQKNGVSIPNATSATFTIPTTSEGDAGTYSVVVSNAGSAVTSNGATLQFASDPYTTYVTGYGLDPATTGAPDADYDTDGIATRLEFFLGGNPTVADSGQIIPTAALSPGQDAIVIQFDRSKQASDVPFSVEYSASMTGTWSTAVHGADGVTIVVSPLNTSFDRVKVTIPATGSTLFARLRL